METIGGRFDTCLPWDSTLPEKDPSLDMYPLSLVWFRGTVGKDLAKSYPFSYEQALRGKSSWDRCTGSERQSQAVYKSLTMISKYVQCKHSVQSESVVKIGKKSCAKCVQHAPSLQCVQVIIFRATNPKGHEVQAGALLIHHL